MAGGVSFLKYTLTNGGTRIYDLTETGFTPSGTVLFNRADGRSYPQMAATVDRDLAIDFTGYDLGMMTSSSSGSELIGKETGSGGMVLVILKNRVSGQCTVTANPMQCVRASARMLHPQLSMVTQQWLAAGKDGSEPVVTIANT